MGNKYSYFDHPEGTHGLYKTACVVRYTATAGFCLWLMDVITYSRSKNVGQALVRLPLWMVPAIFPPAVAVMTTCLLNENFPKKNDASNFAYGAMAGSAVLGAVRRSTLTGYHSALLTGFFTYCVRDIDNHYHPVWFAPPKRFHGQWDSMDSDYTMKADRGPYTGWEQH